MKRKITCFIMLIILPLSVMVGCFYQASEMDITINNEKALVTCINEGKEIDNIYYDYENNIIITKTIKEQGIDEFTMIFRASSTGEYQLIKNTKGQINDKLYNAITNTFTSFDSNRVSYIGEGKDNLYFIEYEESILRIISYSIKDKNFEEIEEYNFEGNLVEGIGYYNSNDNVFYWSYSDENGSNIVIIDDNKVNKYLIDMNQISDVVVLKNTDNEFVVYKGFNNNTTPYTYSPEIVTIEKATSKITKSEELSILKNKSKSLFFSEVQGENQYLLFRAAGGSISVFRVNDENFTLLRSYDNFDCQVAKVTQDEIIMFDGENVVSLKIN